jgi:hypothetical protein
MKTKWRRLFEYEKETSELAIQKLDAQTAAMQTLRESYEAQVAGLKRVYNDLMDRYNREFNDGWVEALATEQNKLLAEQNQRLSRKILDILEVIQEGDQIHHEVYSDPA